MAARPARHRGTTTRRHRRRHPCARAETSRLRSSPSDYMLGSPHKAGTLACTEALWARELKLTKRLGRDPSRARHPRRALARSVSSRRWGHLPRSAELLAATARPTRPRDLGASRCPGATRRLDRPAALARPTRSPPASLRQSLTCSPGASHGSWAATPTSGFDQHQAQIFDFDGQTGAAQPPLGVREHAMASIATAWLPRRPAPSSPLLRVLDYMRPPFASRHERLPLTYVFTHDSIAWRRRRPPARRASGGSARHANSRSSARRRQRDRGRMAGALATRGVALS